MSGVYQFDEYMASAREALKEGKTDTAKDWVHQALSLSKHLEDEALAKAHELKAEILIAEEEYTEAEEALQTSVEMFRRNAQGHVLLGELMLLDGRHEGAATAFELALEIAPENSRARCMLIFCYCQLGKRDRAKECFDQCVEHSPHLADGYYHMAICLFHEGKAGAKELFESALSKNPVLSGPHYYLGRMKIAEGDLAGAQVELSKELESNPANSLAELELIRSYFLEVRWEEAVELFDRHFPPEAFCDIPALKVCHFHFNYELLDERFRSFLHAVKKELPQTPENLFHVAKVYRYKSLFGEASEHLKKVLEEDRSFRRAYGELAELYRIQAEPGRACEVMEEAARTFGDAEAYRELGTALLACGRYGEAEEAARKAVSLGPEDAGAHYLLGVSLGEASARATGPSDLVQEARRHLEKALEINPDHTGARGYLLHVMFQEGKYDECLRAAEGALEKNPQERLALTYSGRCLQAKGELGPAEERLLKLVALYPDDRGGLSSLAEVYRAQGKFTEAVEQLEQAIASAGRRPPPELLFRVGEIHLVDLNDAARAREYLLAFLQMAPEGHPDHDRAIEYLGRIKA